MRSLTQSLPNLSKPLTATMLAAAILLVAGTAQAGDHGRGHGDRDWKHGGKHYSQRDHHRGRDNRHWHKPQRHYHRDRDHSSFSFNWFVNPRPAYYPTYYQQPVVYQQPIPVNYQPINYTSPPAYDDMQDRYCREYQRDVVVGGRMQQSYGQACMQPDGDWEIISGT